MRVLMLGNYDLNNYSRARVLMKGLQRNGVQAETLTTPSYPAMAARLLQRNVDMLLVNGKFTLLTAWLLKWWHQKPIVFDAFISDYDTLVHDRKLVSPYSPKSFALWWSDKLACMLADHNIFDTQEHLDYFVSKFKTSRKKCSVIPVGADDDVFKPMQKAHRGLLVSFDGTYIPLQGVEFILQAAKLLPKVRFQLIGKGQTYEEMRALADQLKLTNVTFKNTFVSLEKLARLIAPADIGLGIFGTTHKAQRVIPNKVYHLLAMGKPVITADTPAMRRVFSNEVLLVPAGNARALADAITRLQDAKERMALAKRGFAIYQRSCSIKKIGALAKFILKKL